MPVAFASLNLLVQRLHQAGVQAPDMAQKVLEEAGNDIADGMRERVPIKTGRLYMSIQVQSYRGKVVVGPVDVPYALYVEYGTSRMAAQPYMRPAAQEWVDRTNKMMGERAVRLIETGSYK